MKTAEAFGTVPEMLPYIPELLAGMWSLGIPSDIVADIFRDHDPMPEPASVLDLGCGKGANSITLAREFGFQVHGIDLFGPFIEEARKLAQDMGVEHLCRFDTGDIKQAVQDSINYDIVLLVWVGGVLGDAGQSVRRIRKMIRPGGYMLIGEGFLKDGVKADSPFLERFDRHETLRGKLTMQGDTPVHEIVIPDDRISDFYRNYINSLRTGARKCASEHPEHAHILWDYVDSNEQMCKIMEGKVESGLWLVRKN